MIALIVFGQQHQVAEPFLGLFLETAAAGHIDFTADDGLDALGFRLPVQIDDAVHIAVIGNGHSGHIEFFRSRYHVGNLAQPVE